MYSQTQLASLRAVLDADVPTYGGLSDQDAAVALNDLTVVRIRSSMSGDEIALLIDSAEYDAVSSADKSVFVGLCGMGTLAPANGGSVHQTIASLFGNNITAANIISARNETVSAAADAGLPRCRAGYVRLARLLP